MKVNFGDDNNVSLDTTYNINNISALSSQLTTQLALIKPYDPSNIVSLVGSMESQYHQLENFEKMIAEWNEVKDEVEL